MEEDRMVEPVSFDQVATSLMEVGSSMLHANQPLSMIAALDRAVSLLGSLSASLSAQHQQQASLVQLLDMSTSVSFQSDYTDSFMMMDDPIVPMDMVKEEEEEPSSIVAPGSPAIFDPDLPIQSSPPASPLVSSGSQPVHRPRRERHRSKRFIEIMPGEPTSMPKKKSHKKKKPRPVTTIRLGSPVPTTTFKPVRRDPVAYNRILGPTGRYMSLDYYTYIVPKTGENQ